MSEAHGFLCGPKLYEYDGWFFEFAPFPWPLRKDGEPRKHAGDKFYAMIDKFQALPEAERRRFRVGGGCRAF